MILVNTIHLGQAQEYSKSDSPQLYLLMTVDSLSGELIDLDGEAAWNSIITANRGKAIYANLCGTWCKGCMKSFSDVKAHRERFEDKGLNYIYIWYKSDSKEIEVLIEKYQLSGKHYFLKTEEQLKYIQNKLNNEGFPAYFLLDKKGNIFKKVAAFPSNPESFEQIEDLLGL